MTFDAGVIVGLVLVFAFFGAVVWAEIYSRRHHRRSPDENSGDTVERAAAQEDGRKPSRPN